jgi:L-iditol 2-dehydrogenase
VEFRDETEPSPKSDEVIIDVKAAAICGSDVGIYDYTSAYSKMKLPVIIGHEFAGVISDIGSINSNFKIGDRVTAESVKSCGSCIYCRSGNENLCDKSTLFGIHENGGFAQKVAVPVNLLHQLPDDITFEEGALIEPLSNALHFVKDCTPIKFGDFIVVHGVGPIGLFAAQLFKLAGADVLLTGVNIDKERFKIASNLGFQTINVETDDLDGLVKDHSKGLGADISFVATGASLAVTQAVQIIKKQGTVMIIGIFGKPVEVPLTTVVRREIIVKGAYDARPENFDQSIKLVKNGEVKASQLITHRLPLENVEEAFSLAKSKLGCKVLLIP